MESSSKLTSSSESESDDSSEELDDIKINYNRPRKRNNVMELNNMNDNVRESNVYNMNTRINEMRKWLKRIRNKNWIWNLIFI